MNNYHLAYHGYVFMTGTCTDLKICIRGRILHSLTPFFLGTGLAVTLICEAAENSYGSLMEIESAFAVIEVNSIVKSSDGNRAIRKKYDSKNM